MEFLEVFFAEVHGYWNWLVGQVSALWNPSIPNPNYFYGLIGVSLAVWALELLFPWRKNQAAIRKDFWLDGFYMFFNFFIFGLVISGIYALLAKGF